MNVAGSSIARGPHNTEVSIFRGGDRFDFLIVSRERLCEDGKIVLDSAATCVGKDMVVDNRICVGDARAFPSNKCR